MQMTDITIPPAALEAGARALCLHPDLIVDNHTPICPGPAWRLYVDDVRAAFLAMIEAWPEMRISWLASNDGAIVLPLPPQENPDAEA